MRVVHLVPALFGPAGVVGGAERYALELARAMNRVVSTRLVTFGDADADEVVDRLPIRTIGQPWFVKGQRFNPVSVRLFREIADADVVHCHQHHVLASSLASVWCRARGRRVFVSELGGGGWDVSAFVSTDRWFHGHLHLSAYSRTVCGHADSPRAHVIGGGVDAEKFSPDPGVPRDGGALFVGRLLPHKGVEDLVRGVPPDVPLTIASPQPEPGVYDALVPMARGKQVRFAFGLSDVEIVRAYRRASSIVLPSVYRWATGESRVPELLGQTLLEGMACEAPGVCTRVASLPEVVADGVTGFVVPPNEPAALGERLAWLHRHPDQGATLGQAGRRRVVSQFTWPLVVDRCLAAYAGASSEAPPQTREHVPEGSASLGQCLTARASRGRRNLTHWVMIR